ncbi:hypothetical protein X975_15701, partial [Stegodyphus mimosarum]
MGRVLAEMIRPCTSSNERIEANLFLANKFSVPMKPDMQIDHPFGSKYYEPGTIISSEFQFSRSSTVIYCDSRLRILKYAKA